MFVFALLVSYRSREEAIYTASFRFENTTIVLAYQRCVVHTPSRVFALISGQMTYFFMHFPTTEYIYNQKIIMDFSRWATDNYTWQLKRGKML